MTVLILKSLHIIGFVFWFLGIFSLTRLLSQHHHTAQKDEPQKSILIAQFRKMEWQVYKNICNPAMMLTWVFGLYMLHIYGVEWLKENPWMHIKLSLLTLLTVYHVWLGKQMKKRQTADIGLSSYHHKLIHLMPAVFLTLIVLFASIKDIAAVGKVFGILVIIGIFLILGSKFFNRQ